MSTYKAIQTLAVILGGLSLITSCASTPRPFDGTLGYRVKHQPEGWQVTYTDEYHHSREAMLLNIAKVCTELADRPIDATDLVIMGDKAMVVPIQMPILVAEGTQTTGSPNIGPPSNWSPVEPVTTRQSVVQSVEVREITALCP